MKLPAPLSSDDCGKAIPPAERVAAYSLLVNVFLLGLNLAMANYSGSLALLAETAHNLADLAASGAVWLGLRLSQRKSRAFPYGLYKIENMAAIIVGLFIFLTAYEIAKEALVESGREIVMHPLILLGVMSAALVPWLFSRYELRVARAVNSPSLTADAREFQAHVLSSGVVFASLLGQWVGWPLDRPAALLIVLWIVQAGWETVTAGMRVLLDASIDAETLQRVRRVIERQPAVVEVRSLAGRNAGRYRFLEAEIGVRSQSVGKAHQVSHAIEEEIRKEIPFVERVLIHIEPVAKAIVCIAVPLTDQTGGVSRHFGLAPYFAFMERQVATGQIVEQKIIANPFADHPKGRGLEVAHWLLEQHVDAVVTPDDIRDKGPGHALGDAGVAVILSEATTLDRAIRELPVAGGTGGGRLMTAIRRQNEQAMSATTEFGREIEVASRLAREAGEGILTIYATDFAVRYKAGRDPVTEADRLASRVIVDGLRREFPEDMVVSEEESIDPMRAIPARVWYVDPVDGTREFIKRNGEFAVMIGLAVDGCAQLGVVFRPVTAELFAGIVEREGWLERAGETIPLRVSGETRPASLRMATSRSHRHRLVDKLVQRLAIREEHRIGSVGIKVGMLVTRQSDVYLEPSGMTKAWDSCAPEAVLRAAGGRMTDLMGIALHYSPRDVQNRQGLVATNGACHATVISAIASVLREHG